MAGFISRQIERDKLSTEIYSNIGLPTAKNFNIMVSTNMIQKLPISVTDIINDEKIYGTLMAILKGNSTRIKPRPVIKDDIKIPRKILKTIQTLNYALTSPI